MKIQSQRYRSSQQGFAHIFLVILVLAGMAGIGGFAVWRISSYDDSAGKNAIGKAENDGSGKNTATLSAECLAMTHDENICHLGAIDSLEKHASIIKISMQGPEGTQTFTEKFDGKGNNTVEGNGIQGITYNGHTYIQLDGKWLDSGGDASQKPNAPAPPALATTAGVKYENLGKEACGKDTCFRYRCTGGILGDSTVLVTFGTKDYLPRHYDIKTPEGSAGLLGNMTMDISYEDVKISAPEGAITMEQYQQQVLGG